MVNFLLTFNIKAINNAHYDEIKEVLYFDTDVDPVRGIHERRLGLKQAYRVSNIMCVCYVKLHDLLEVDYSWSNFAHIMDALRFIIHQKKRNTFLLFCALQF